MQLITIRKHTHRREGFKNIVPNIKYVSLTNNELNNK